MYPKYAQGFKRENQQNEKTKREKEANEISRDEKFII